MKIQKSNLSQKQDVISKEQIGWSEDSVRKASTSVTVEWNEYHLMNRYVVNTIVKR